MKCGQIWPHFCGENGMKRPAVVTVVSYYFLINLFMILTKILLNYFLGFTNLELESLIMMNIGVIVSAIPALLMLNGKNSGRILYIFFEIFAIGYSVYNANGYPPALIGRVAPIILFIVSIILLYQPAANEYFNTSKSGEVQK
ncbi:hypothetical protein [Haemophilus sp.]